MKKGKTIFLIVYLVFHLVLLVAAIVVNQRAEDFKFLFSVRDNMGAAVWFAVVGLILFILNAMMVSISTRNHEKTEEKLRQEINTLKSKLYDLQDTRPTQTPTPLPKEKPETPPSDKSRNK